MVTATVRKVFVYMCVKCKESFESYDGQHRQKCPGCGSMCSVKESHNEDEE